MKIFSFILIFLFCVSLSSCFWFTDSSEQTRFSTFDDVPIYVDTVACLVPDTTSYIDSLMLRLDSLLAKNDSLALLQLLDSAQRKINKTYALDSIHSENIFLQRILIFLDKNQEKLIMLRINVESVKQKFFPLNP